MYVELHARSAFSFLAGASLPEELAAYASALELPAIALTDRDGVYGAPRFHMAAKKTGVKAHIGSEICFSPRVRLSCFSAQPAFIGSRVLIFFRGFWLCSFWVPPSMSAMGMASPAAYFTLYHLLRSCGRTCTAVSY